MKDKNNHHKQARLRSSTSVTSTACATQKPEPKWFSRVPILKKGCSAIYDKLSRMVNGLPASILKNAFPIMFFAVVWALLAFYEEGLLFRVNELSLFLYDDLYYEEMMSAPAGLLSYISCYLVQFFYAPAVGATIYVALLVSVYWLTYKVFDISQRYRLLAMVPVVALLASNTQLGYWIFYIKVPGYYYVALVGVVASLLAAWVVKKSHIYLKPLLVAAWIYFVYPYLGIYAIVSGVIMALHSLSLEIGRNRKWQRVVISSVTLAVSLVLLYYVPGKYYTEYTTVPRDEMLTRGLPASQWKSEHVPGHDEKVKAVSLISGMNGRVGYPVDKELTKYKMNIDASFSQKSMATAKSELYANGNINRPVAGKTYTFTFVGKSGQEYYLNRDEHGISFVTRTGDIPQTGHFICEPDGKVAELAAFKTDDGKYLVWNVDSLPDGVRYSVGLATSKSEGNTRCAVVKMKKEGVSVKEDSELFGIVNLIVIDNNLQQLFVVGVDDGVLNGSGTALLNEHHTSALRIEEVGFTPSPFPLAMTERSMWFDVNTYWIPFWVLLAAFLILALIPAVPQRIIEFQVKENWALHLICGLLALYLVAFSYIFWYKNENFRLENEQNKAMWEEDWERVARLAKEADTPTRQVVMNKNIALLKLGRSGKELFAYPEGSADIEAPMPVRLAQTGGKMAYFQYGKLNFCYRWCVEDAVEYGWRIEYLKHAVRSMLLSGEYRLAERYIKILKRTKYYADWASEMEKHIHNPKLIDKNKAFEMPLAMACYDDALDVDESYVEAYLTKNLTNTPANGKMSRLYVEASLASSLTRKDSRSFWFFLNYYVNELKVNRLPKHYQEAVLLFLNLDKGKTVQVPQAFLDRFVSKNVEARMNNFMANVKKHNGKSEEQMAPYFKDDFGDTYFYFYFFVRNIKTN